MCDSVARLVRGRDGLLVRVWFAGLEAVRRGAEAALRMPAAGAGIGAGLDGALHADWMPRSHIPSGRPASLLALRWRMVWCRVGIRGEGGMAGNLDS